ncbi:MAG: 8-oxo-dGTP diphosphatase MutT [Thermoanaerobaculales bacterium]|jgi:8-oxo-dGTP diphosphatase|nr:8-oxo-dGTP diphosphatase MutT [Thermoanaerobaculales bacterium]
MISDSGMTIVVAAVIRDGDGRILLARRPEGLHMGGLWEFPGGKVEPGETPEEAMRRELREELGVSSKVGEPMTFAVHTEPGMCIVLLFYSVALSGSRPQPAEGQDIAWVAPENLGAYAMPPADAELVRQLVEETKG